MKWSRWSQRSCGLDTSISQIRTDLMDESPESAAWNANQQSNHQFIVDLLMENGDFPWFFVCLPEDSLQKMVSAQGGTRFTSKSGACAVLLRHQPFQLEIFRDGLLLQTFNARPTWRDVGPGIADFKSKQIHLKLVVEPNKYWLVVTGTWLLY